MIVRGIGKTSLHQILQAPAIRACTIPVGLLPGPIEQLLMLMSMHRPARA
jgi:hypothetical protein